MTLVDPLPKDHLLEGLVWEEQANHLHWERRGGGWEGRRGEGVLGLVVGVQIVRMGQEEKGEIMYK